MREPGYWADIFSHKLHTGVVSGQFLLLSNLPPLASHFRSRYCLEYAFQIRNVSRSRKLPSLPLPRSPHSGIPGVLHTLADYSRRPESRIEPNEIVGFWQYEIAKGLVQAQALCQDCVSVVSASVRPAGSDRKKSGGMVGGMRIMRLYTPFSESSNSRE